MVKMPSCHLGHRGQMNASARFALVRPSLTLVVGRPFQHLSPRHMTSFLRRATPLLTAAAIAACATGGMRRTASDEAADRAALLRLHAEQRTAHLEHRADILVAGQADTLWNVSGGRISANPREQARASFQAYFDVDVLGVG